MPHSNVDFGKCVRAAQGMRRMTNEDIASSLGTTKQQISRYRSQPDCKLKTALALSEIFGFKNLQDMLELDR